MYVPSWFYYLLALVLSAGLATGCDAELSSTPEDEGPNIDLTIPDASDPGAPTIAVGSSAFLVVTATDDVLVRDVRVDLVRGDEVLTTVSISNEASEQPFEVEFFFDIPPDTPPSGAVDEPYAFRASAEDEAGNRDSVTLEVILVESE